MIAASKPLAKRIARAVEDLVEVRPMVAFDGPDTAGKTMLANATAAAASVPVCRASIDGFHAPAAVRRRRGELSPEGYYRDSFNYRVLDDHLLTPFRNGASEVRIRSFDYRDDQQRNDWVRLERRCALLFDGVFLLRPELQDQWTLRIYLHISDQQILSRAAQRDVALFGSSDAVVERYKLRYLPGQALYRAEAHPCDMAHIVVDNNDPSAPQILRWDIPPGAA